MKKKIIDWSIITAVILIIALVIVFVVRGREERITVPEGAEAGDIFLEPDIYKAGSNEYDMQRGTLIVSESEKTGKLIALPVIRYISPAENPAEPIFYFSGGPGTSNMKHEPSPDLLKNHDIVLVGYRGVDGSVKLDCPSVQEAVNGEGDYLLSEESLSKISQAFADDAIQLQAAGIDLNAYTMIEVISDMETARTALGYGKINLMSSSYGTRIAQIYANKHPQTIYRSVMIGVNPPGRFVWEADTIDRQIGYYAGLYSQSYNADAGIADLSQTMKDVLENMPERWFVIPIDKGKVEVVTNVLLYHISTSETVFDAYIAADKGDYSGLAFMSLAYNFMMPSLYTWGDTASKAVSADFDPNYDYLLIDEDGSSVIGSPISKLLWTASSWPVDTIPEEYRTVQESDTETLLISGNIDFSTPAEYATNELLPYLNNGQQVIIKEMGHTDDFFGEQHEARARLLTSFFDTGIADDSLYKYSPIGFKAKLSLPLIAKLSIVFLVVILLLIAFVIWRIIRRIKKKKAKLN